MGQEIVSLDQKMSQEIGSLNQKMNEMDQKFDELKQENKQLCRDMKSLHEKVEEIHDQQFVFEQEYGTKIDAILDAVSLELDKNLEKSQKIRNLAGRMDRGEVVVFDHEKRISKLELKK